MTYDFRTRGILATTVKIESPDTELELYNSGQVRVSIKAAEFDTPLTDGHIKESVAKGPPETLRLVSVKRRD